MGPGHDPAAACGNTAVPPPQRDAAAVAFCARTVRTL